MKYIKGHTPANKGKKGWTNNGSFKKGHKSVSKPMTEETKIKLRLANIGRKLTPEHKEKLRQAKLRNPVRYWKGKHTPVFGNKCHLWRGGITPERLAIRSSLEYKLWRTAVFERDNYTCVWCGNNKSGNLNAHHIKPFSRFPELRFAIDNGITLCRDCHKSTDSYMNRNI
jgi:hypothetical protein